MGALQLLGDQLQSEDLLVDVDVGPAGVHADLLVALLGQQTFAEHWSSVSSGLAAVPAALVVAALRHVLAEKLRNAGPELFGAVHGVADLPDEGLEAGVLQVRERLLRRQTAGGCGGNGRVVAAAAAVGCCWLRI